MTKSEQACDKHIPNFFLFDKILFAWHFWRWTKCSLNIDISNALSHTRNLLHTQNQIEKYCRCSYEAYTQRAKCKIWQCDSFHRNYEYRLLSVSHMIHVCSRSYFVYRFGIGKSDVHVVREKWRKGYWTKKRYWTISLHFQRYDILHIFDVITLSI